MLWFGYTQVSHPFFVLPSRRALINRVRDMLYLGLSYVHLTAVVPQPYARRLTCG